MAASARRPDRRLPLPPPAPHRPYFADFACDRLRLVLEIDGGVHRLDEVVLRDHLRQVELEGLGWTVLRFSNEQALTRPEQIFEAIRKHARELGL